MLGKIVNLLFWILLLIVGLTAYSDGGSMAIRLIGIPIPAWIFFPLVGLFLFGSILSLFSRGPSPQEIEQQEMARAAEKHRAEVEDQSGRKAVICPACGHENDRYASFCTKCLADLSNHSRS